MYLLVYSSSCLLCITYVWVYMVRNMMRYHRSMGLFTSTLAAGFMDTNNLVILELCEAFRVVSQIEVREVPFHPWTLPVGWQMQGCKDSGGGQTFSIVNPEGCSFAACSFPPLVQQFKTCSRVEFDTKT